MELPLTSIVIAELPSRPKRKAATKATAILQPSTKRKRSSPSITESDKHLASVQTCPPTTSSFSTRLRSKRRQLIKRKSKISQSFPQSKKLQQKAKMWKRTIQCTHVLQYEHSRLSTISHQITRGQKRPWQSEKQKDYMKAIQIKTFTNLIELFIITSKYIIDFLINHFVVYFCRGGNLV